MFITPMCAQTTVTLLALLTLAVFSPRALAQDDEADTPSAALQAARDKYGQGVKLAKAGKNDEAVAAFEAALPELGREEGADIFYNLVNLARVKRDWKRLILYSHGFLARESGTKDANEVGKLREFALGRLDVRAPAGELIIAAPEGAVLYVNHTPVTTRTLRLARGRYTVTAELADHLPAHVEVTVGDASTTATLSPKLANYTGFLSASPTPADGVTIYVDEVVVGRTPLASPLELPVGKRLVRFEKAGFDTWSRYVDIVRGKTETLEPRLEKTR